MQVPSIRGTVVRFGLFEADLEQRLLTKSGNRVRLQDQPFQILKLLLERPGELVTREEIRQNLWSGDTYVAFDDGLNTAIKKLRRALNDTADNPRFIETIPRRGYRFIAPVADELLEPSPSPHVLATLPLVPTVTSPTKPLPYRLRWTTPTLGILILLLLATAGFFFWPRPKNPESTTGRRTLAVLPFENLTGDPGQEYFADGLTEELISQIGNLDPERLSLIARTSVMHYKKSQAPLNQIGRELNVQYVLEGSVRLDADKVRVTAQLTRVKDQKRLWARQYDRELLHVLNVQGEIAEEVSNEIQLTLADHPKPDELAHRPPLSSQQYEAYDLYLRGRYSWNKRSIQDLRQAVNYFEQAIAKDPGYARAYAGLADSYAILSAYDDAPPSELIPQARAAAQRALSLDEKLAEAHVSLAFIAQDYDWDWQTAEKEYRRAIELDPNYATGHHWYAEYLALRGRFDEASAEIKRARQLDPLSLIMQADNGVILYFSRQYDPAIAQFRAVLEMEPDFARANMVAFAHSQKGQFDDALTDLENWRRIDTRSPWIWVMQAYIYGSSGRPVQARHALEKLQSINRRSHLDPFLFIAPYIALGDKNQAFSWLDKSIAAHSPGLTGLQVDPIYDPLRSDPRFQKLLRRVRLAQ